MAPALLVPFVKIFAPHVIVGKPPMEIFAPLSDPTPTRLEDTILILYPVPTGIEAGIDKVMVPDNAVELTLPIFVGVAKLPELFDNCAVNVFPALKMPEAV
jgi:hypothetical protein